MSKIKALVPILSWLPQYGKHELSGDLSAGLTVGVMLIPQGMAYSMLAGLPPIYGLYAATVPLILYAIFGTSRQMSIGPAAMISLLVATGVSHLATPGSNEFIFLAITLAFMVGVFQFLLGALRLGFVVNFLAHPVISGFTSAAALIIGLTQLKNLLRIDIPRSSYIHEILMNVYQNINQIHTTTLLLGVGGIILILLLKRVNRAIPGQLLAVIGGISLVYFLKLDQKGLHIVGEVPEGLPVFAIPNLSWVQINELFTMSLTIALICLVESIAIAKAIQARHKNYEVDANQELVALGLANIGGAFFQAFPTAGGFGRTAVNDQAGAKTGMASIISAFLIILTLLFLTPLFYFLPTAILASVIMVAVFGLIDLKEARYLWKTDRRDFWMLAVTFIATLTLGIELGIAIGVALSLGMVVYRSAYPHLAILGKMPGSMHYRNIKRFKEVEQRDDILIMRFDAQLFFANVGYLKDTIRKYRQEMPSLKLIILNAEAINGLDSSAVRVLTELILELRINNIDLYLSGVKGPVRDVMFKSGLMDLVGKDHFFMQTHDAVVYFNSKHSRSSSSFEKAAQTDLN